MEELVQALNRLASAIETMPRSLTVYQSSGYHVGGRGSGGGSIELVKVAGGGGGGGGSGQ